MLKMQIVDYLRNQTAFFEPSLVSEIFTAILQRHFLSNEIQLVTI